MTWCILHGGPADGLMLPTADQWCTRRLVIYSLEGHMFNLPSVYLRDETDQGTHRHVGADGVEREFPSVGYRFERYASPELARNIQAVRNKESEADAAERASDGKA